MLVIPKAQWQEREFKPFGINGTALHATFHFTVHVLFCWCMIQLTNILFHRGTDEQGTCYAKLLLASREEVLKQVTFVFDWYWMQ